MKDPDSIRNFYKTMIALRMGSDILKFGTFVPIKISKKLFIYKREFKGQSLMVLLNFSDCTQRVPYKSNVVLSNYLNKGFDGLLQPYEAVIMKNG